MCIYFIERINCFLNTESIQLNYEANRGGQGNGGAIYWLTNMIYLIPNRLVLGLVDRGSRMMTFAHGALS